ncbi:MAG: DUF4279 domain-containing protein [Colwellia sp.]|nr:DUF4279 domain-containing protein [Colwellia sp.]
MASTNHLKAIQVAQEEVLNKRWGITQQVLEVHSVVFCQDGNPEVKRVYEKEPGEDISVFFAIQDQPYFYVVVVTVKENDFAVGGGYIEAKVRVYLGIYSEELTRDEITKRLGIEPFRSWRKGQPFRASFPQRKHEEHACQFHAHPETPGSVEEKLDELVRQLTPVKDEIRQLGESCRLEVTIVYENWGGDPQFGGFNLNAGHIKFISTIGAEVDCDLYSFGPKMLGEEK